MNARSPRVGRAHGALRALSFAAALLLGLGLLPGCESLRKTDLPKSAPPLADMEEPLALHEEPKDEAERRALPLGTFTGITVATVRRALDEPVDGGAGLRVQKVIENSPADVAGIEEDDLLLEATPEGQSPRALRWPGDWKKAEADAAPGRLLTVVLDRAGDVRTVEVRPVPRVRLPERSAVQRFREEKKVGVVVRTATDVEAHRAGLGAGGGAVVVGLSARSPWRGAGIRFGDLIASVDGRAVSHPQELVTSIHDADGPLEAVVHRDGKAETVKLPVTSRESDLTRFSLPFVYDYEFERGATEWSAFVGFLKYRSTPAAWEMRLFWLLRLAGGDADRLEEVSR